MTQKAIILTGRDKDAPGALRRISGHLHPGFRHSVMRDMDPFTGIVTGAAVCLAFWLAVLLFYWL